MTDKTLCNQNKIKVEIKKKPMRKSNSINLGCVRVRDISVNVSFYLYRSLDVKQE